jgi:hypothetical protein
MLVKLVWSLDNKTYTKIFHLVDEDDEIALVRDEIFTERGLERIKRDGFVLLKDVRQDGTPNLSFSFLHSSLIVEIEPYNL